MKAVCLILAYLLIGYVNFFIFIWGLYFKQCLCEDSLKNALKNSFLDSCRDLQKLDLNDSPDIFTVIVLIAGWPIIVVFEVILFPCVMITFSIKHIAKTILKKSNNPKPKDKKSKKISNPKSSKNTKSVQEPNYNPDKVTLKTSELDNPPRKRIKKASSKGDN
jgi:hypothetical protein